MADKKPNPATFNFSDMLHNSDDIEPRLKKLWIEIYENASLDREHAKSFITELRCAMSTMDANAHAMHGPQIVKYLEKANKATDQLLKLAEQLLSFRAEEGKIESDELLDEIQETGPLSTDVKKKGKRKTKA